MFRFQQNHQNQWVQDLTSWGYGSNYTEQPESTLEATTSVIHPDNNMLQFQATNQPNLITNMNARLCDEELWQKFSDVGTEMVLTKKGRRIFPGYRVKFSGLDPNALYNVILDIVQTDSNRYRFQSGQWIVGGKGEIPHIQNHYVHPISEVTGQKLMEEIVSFHKVKLTNTTANRSQDTIVLHSMHRYQIRVHLSRSNNQHNIQTFEFPQTTFITVTAYQNSELSQLKIKNNPYAKGFRADGKRKNKRTCSNEDEYFHNVLETKKVCKWDQQQELERSYNIHDNSSSALDNTDFCFRSQEHCPLNIYKNNTPTHQPLQMYFNSPNSIASQDSDHQTFYSGDYATINETQSPQSLERVDHTETLWKDNLLNELCNDNIVYYDDPGYVSASPAEFLDNDDVSKFLFGIES
ncbi:optomotor-blind protein-like [Styela clava]